MKKDNIFYRLLILFVTFMKIGVLTFGGGYAMIPIIIDEVTKKHKWVTEMEILDIVAISESTPGPVSVNAATYIGYRVAGIWGGIISTIALAIPSFVIILIISFFYEDFMKIQAFQAIFKGLKVGVIILLFSAVIKLKKGVKTSVIGVILFIVSLVLMLTFSFFSVKFDYLSLCLIALGLLVGIVVTAITSKGGKKEWFSLNSFTPSSV